MIQILKCKKYIKKNIFSYVFFVNIKMTNNYYQKSKEKLQKDVRERYTQKKPKKKPKKKMKKKS